MTAQTKRDLRKADRLLMKAVVAFNNVRGLDGLPLHLESGVTRLAVALNQNATRSAELLEPLDTAKL